MQSSDRNLAIGSAVVLAFKQCYNVANLLCLSSGIMYKCQAQLQFLQQPLCAMRTCNVVVQVGENPWHAC